MPPAVIANPILNSPFEEPRRHFAFTEDGITNEIVDERRSAGYFVPVPPPKKKGKQLQIENWTADRWEESQFVNRVRERVKLWRDQGWPGATSVTSRLLAHWSDPERERRLFFCQLEAVETAIYLAEVADRDGNAWIANAIREANEGANPGLYRVALKMATGSGKTVVMGMLIAWQALNKLANRQDRRFSDAFLLVTPGITIRDRLRVLLPSDPESYYRKLELVPPDWMPRLGSARIAIVNYHAFLRREKVKAAKTTKQILDREQRGAFTETAGEMVRRVCRELGQVKDLVVLNDEAHHCYRPRPKGQAEAPEEKLTGEDRREAKRRDAEARVWVSGLEAIQRKLGIRAIYDLSATPFFLPGSGYLGSTLFPWVVSDFSLIDAIEAGIVKVPRVPVADDAMTGNSPTYRDLWSRVGDGLPGPRHKAVGGATKPVLPKELEGAIESLYEHYQKGFARWEADIEARHRGLTPPVFIVVCNNTRVSKLVFDYLSGYAKVGEDGEPLSSPDGQPVLVPGACPLFSNVVDGRWADRPVSILVDSQQLESGEAMSPEFKKIAASEIEEWKAEIRARFPGRDTEGLTDEDLLREVMNTVGKPGKLGEAVRCVVSVSMLTEGWDANTVTHILGVRAFKSPLLTEQVVGRGLRRVSYATNDEDRFEPEYAEVYGVPFSFIPTAGSSPETLTESRMTRVRFLEERAGLDIRFPRVDGNRYEVGTASLVHRFEADSLLSLSTADVPTKVENAPVVGESVIHTIDELRRLRLQEVDFVVTKVLLERFFAHQPWRFPELLRIVRTWREGCLDLKDRVFPQLLWLQELRAKAAEKVARSITAGEAGEGRILPILAPYDPVGSATHVDFSTGRPTWPTRADKSCVSHVVADTGTWEQKVAESLEEMDEVLAYLKNDHLGLRIPYTLAGARKSYVPDFLVRWDDGRGPVDPLHLVLEVSGEKEEEKDAKVATARSSWIPAVNHLETLGRWAFFEIRDPWKCQKDLREFVSTMQSGEAA